MQTWQNCSHPWSTEPCTTCTPLRSRESLSHSHIASPSERRLTSVLTMSTETGGGVRRARMTCGRRAAFAGGCTVLYSEAASSARASGASVRRTNPLRTLLSHWSPSATIGLMDAGCGAQRGKESLKGSNRRTYMEHVGDLRISGLESIKVLGAGLGASRRGEGWG